MFRFYLYFALSVVFILLISSVLAENRLALLLSSVLILFLSALFATWRFKLTRSDLKKALKSILKEGTSS